MRQIDPDAILYIPPRSTKLVFKSKIKAVELSLIQTWWWFLRRGDFFPAAGRGPRSVERCERSSMNVQFLLKIESFGDLPLLQSVESIVS